MLVSELEGLDEADGLVDRATHRQVVDGDLAKNAVWADNEGASQ